MVFCCVFNCTNRSENCTKSFFRIPTILLHHDEEAKQLSTERKNKWFCAIKREDMNFDATHYRVCSDHFITGKPAKLFEKSHPDWIPNQSMGYEKKLTDISRHKRAIDRQHVRGVTDIIQKKEELQVVAAPSSVDFKDSILHSINVIQNQHHAILNDSKLHDIDFEVVGDVLCKNNFKDSSCQTSLTNKHIISMDEELSSSKSKICNLMSELSILNVGTIEWFVSDEKVLFYTGLPNMDVFFTLFKFIRSFLLCKRSKLSDFQHLSLTLMRLRLNLTLNDLAYRYNVSCTTASSVFLKTIDVLYVRLKELIKWPDREQLCKTTPMCFRQHFGTRVGVVIDCFEVFIDKPKNALARAQTFSSYKHHNTVKFLIGIAPQGVVSFISKSWGGRVSDKYLTENCGFLSKLLPGDVVLADRGFSIEDSIALYCAEVKLQSFTKGKRQLSSWDVEQTRKIASVRVHEERVIGNIRNKYKILQSTIPLDYLIKQNNGLTTMDKIVTISCSLINLNDSVIPFD
nr:uncharacterized protein LOC124812780 [Hydra vulgaris]